MLENIVVDCSPVTNTLRIGRLNKAKDHFLEWEDREDEILYAVRDFLHAKAQKEKSNTFGYEWDRKDGKVVELRVTIKEPATTEATETVGYADQSGLASVT